MRPLKIHLYKGQQHKYPAERLAWTLWIQRPECIFAFCAICKRLEMKRAVLFSGRTYSIWSWTLLLWAQVCVWRWVWNPLCQLAEPCKADLITFLYCVHPSQNPCQNVSKMFSHNVLKCQDVCTAANDQGRKEGMFGENIWSMFLQLQLVLDPANQAKRADCPFSKLRYVNFCFHQYAEMGK